MRVVQAHRVADDARALHVGPVRLQAQAVHRVQHAAVHGLEPVSHVGQRAPDDHAHRIVEIRGAHLVGEIGPRCGRRCRRRDDVSSAPTCSSVPFSDVQRADVACVGLDELRRGSTWSPISSVKISSAAWASLELDRCSTRVSGLIAVSRSCSEFISPRPLKRLISIPSAPAPGSRAQPAVASLPRVPLAQPDPEGRRPDGLDQPAVDRPQPLQARRTRTARAAAPSS